METKSELVHKLQQDIMMWQGFKPAAAGKAERIGLGAIEDAFPGGVFPKGAIHEFITVFPEDAASAWNNLLEEKIGQIFCQRLIVHREERDKQIDIETLQLIIRQIGNIKK